ncbi:hypothetical protein ACIRRH_43620 [Kitasatospora sp. NPDC101235]|uniref:hypothetical protein n=1 Tax=Kitasatospora sp. NPDC101235 TaxID=3364101 RepID=UPI003801B64D
MTDSEDAQGPQGTRTGDDQAESAADRLRARWAEPVATEPVPWYRRLKRRTLTTTAVTVAAVATAGTLFVVLGPDDPAHYKLTAPQTIGDLTLDPDSAKTLADADARVFPNTPGTIRIHDHFVVAYRTPDATDPSLIVIGATGSFARPVRELDSLLGGPDPANNPTPSDGTKPVGGYTVFPPGPLGGFLKCAAADKGTDLTVACAWADGNTIGGVVDTSATQATIDLPALAERTRTIRAAMTVPDQS